MIRYRCVVAVHCTCGCDDATQVHFCAVEAVDVLDAEQKVRAGLLRESATYEIGDVVVLEPGARARFHNIAVQVE